MFIVHYYNSNFMLLVNTKILLTEFHNNVNICNVIYSYIYVSRCSILKRGL